MSGCSRGCPMRRASRAEAAGSRVTPADVVCFNLATRAETSTGSREPVIGNSFHVASSPCHSVLSHETSTDPSQETFASEKHMRDASERNVVYASCTAPSTLPCRLDQTPRHPRGRDRTNLAGLKRATCSMKHRGEDRGRPSSSMLCTATEPRARPPWRSRGAVA